MTFRLPRLPDNVPFVDPKTGIPTRTGARWWQSVVRQTEQSINGILEAQAAAVAAQTAADTAQAAADTAQAAADTVAATVAGLDIPPSDTRNTTTSTAVTGTDGTINVDATGGMVIVTLLAAASPFPVTIKKIDASANAVRIAAQPGETINGAATFDFTTQGETHICTNNGLAEWYA